MWKRTKKGEAESAAEQSSLFDAAPVKEEAEQRGAPMKIEEEMWRAAEAVECGAGPLNEWRCGEHLGINVTPEMILTIKYPTHPSSLFLAWLRVLFASLATARYRAEALAADERHMAAAYIKADGEARAAWKRVEAAEARALEAERGHLTATLRAEVERKRAEQAEAAGAEARALIAELELDAEEYRAELSRLAQRLLDKDATIKGLNASLEIARGALQRETERSRKVREECVMEEDAPAWEVERAELLRRIEIAESAMASAARETVAAASSTEETLSSARAALLHRLELGASSTCPCCDQTVAAYKRYLHAGQVLWLVDLARAWSAAGGTPETWIHKREIKAVGNDYGFLAYFTPEGHTEPLARCAPREFGSAFSGMWQPTEAGLAFLRGEVKAPSHAMVYNRRVLSSAPDGVTVEQALGAKFDYSEVMPPPSAQERT